MDNSFSPDRIASSLKTGRRWFVTLLISAVFIGLQLGLLSEEVSEALVRKPLLAEGQDLPVVPD